MSLLPDPARSLTGCQEVIFIAYCLPGDAEGRGYADWLRRVDMPFFNAIPGVHHYANWRVSEVLRELAEHQPPPARPGSLRDPDPDY